MLDTDKEIVLLYLPNCYHSGWTARNKVASKYDIKLIFVEKS